MLAVDTLVADTSKSATARTNPARKWRWSRFSLRGLLGLVTVCAIGLGWLGARADHARRQRSAVAALKGATIHYDYQRLPDGALGQPQWDKDATPPGPAILRRLVGENIFANVDGIDLGNQDLEQLPDGSLENLAALDTLECIWLWGSAVRDRDLATIGRLARLKHLALGGCTNISDAGLKQLSRLTQLEQLDLRETAISGAGLAHFKACHRLGVLDVSYVPITKAGAKALGELASIRTLRAEGHAGAVAGDEIMASCGRMRHLRFLWMWYQPVTDEGLRQLRGMPRLEVLYLSGARVTGDGLAHIATIRELAVLHLANCKITGAGLRHLGSLRKLETLELQGDPITDDDLDYLHSLPRLSILELQGTAITDAFADHLRGFPALEYCGTSDTLVSVEARKRAEDILERATKRRP